MTIAQLKPGHEIVECKRCFLRYETAEDVPSSCPHCSDARVGVGNTLDTACADALTRVGELVASDGSEHSPSGVWNVGGHHVHVARIKDGPTRTHVVVVHMVQLRREGADAN